MKQLSLDLGYTEITPQMTIGDREKFEAIKAISPDDILAVRQEEVEPGFNPQPEWEGEFFRNFWVQWHPIMCVFHPSTGWSISFNGDDSDLEVLADKIAEILR